MDSQKPVVVDDEVMFYLHLILSLGFYCSFDINTNLFTVCFGPDNQYQELVDRGSIAAFVRGLEANKIYPAKAAPRPQNWFLPPMTPDEFAEKKSKLEKEYIELTKENVEPGETSTISPIESTDCSDSGIFAKIFSAAILAGSSSVTGSDFHDWSGAGVLPDVTLNPKSWLSLLNPQKQAPFVHGELLNQLESAAKNFILYKKINYMLKNLPASSAWITEEPPKPLALLDQIVVIKGYWNDDPANIFYRMCLYTELRLEECPEAVLDYIFYLLHPNQSIVKNHGDFTVLAYYI